jgi:hypothetical protein
MITDDIEQYAQYNPFMAALAGRDEAAKTDIYRRFSALPEEIADTLTSTETAERIESWEKEGIFPATHSSAVAKLIALSILGIIQSDQIPSLLQKLDLNPEIVQRTTGAITTIIDPALAFLEGYTQPLSAEESGTTRPTMQPLPPLTTKIPPIQEPGGTQGANRNIIDLRKPQQPNA